ncbi:MAG: Fe(3+) ABC transporter substrate-binding protein [Luteolibacter sp.]
MKSSRKSLLLASLATAATLLSAHADVVNVYSHRHYRGDQDINKLFTEKTGIEVKLVNADADQLIERLKSEGENSPADVLITVDAGRLQRAKAEGLLQPLKSEILEKATLPELRDPEGYWHPYTLRARVILVSKERVKEGEIKNYEDLADPKWRGRLLARSSSSSYNQSLAAAYIAANGKEDGEKWAKGIVSNFARPPQGGDRDQIKAIASGLADVCISNTYYLGLLLNSKDEADRKAGESVTVVFPNQDGRGTHVNVSGAAITKHAKNVDQAKAYIEFLASPEVQKMIANSTFEFPANGDVTLSPTHESWGKFKIDTETFPKLGENQAEATRIFDQAGWK